MDEQLKQRLIGATIIVALSVIFVPMLFEDKDHPANSSVENVPALPEAIEERAIELPKTAADVVQQEKKEEKPAEAATGYRVIPLNDAPKPAKSSKSTKAARSAVEASASPLETVEADALVEEDSTAEDQEEPVTRAAKTPADTEAPKLHEQPPAVTESRKFSAAPKSRRTPAKAAAKKPEKPKSADSQFELPEPIEPAPAKSAGAKRIPAPGKPAVAEFAPAHKPSAAAQKPPAETAQKPAGATGSWMVQAGSFAEEANAHALADKLRKRNLTAVVDVVPVGANTMYRVRVGPESSRTHAEQVQKQIENAAGVKSIILPRK
jgi:DedD protein